MHETIPPRPVNKIGKGGSTSRKFNEENIFIKLKNVLRPPIECYAVLAVVKPIVTVGRHMQLKMHFAIRMERRVISLQFAYKAKSISTIGSHNTTLSTNNTSNVKFP